MRHRRTFDRGTVAIDDRLGLVPRSRFFGARGADSVSEAGILQARLEHAVNADWQLRVATQLNTGSLTGLQAGATGFLDDHTLLREFRRHDITWGVAIGQAELVGRFDTGPFAHTLLLGLEHERYNSTEYVLADALVYDCYENLRSGPNVDNIFDATYYARSYNAFRVGVGEPRRVTVSMTARF